MERINIVVPECYADTNLMNVLVGKKCNHQKGCSTVCKTMNERLQNQFAVAIIDKDKRQPEATKQYDEIGKTSCLIVCKHRDRSHYLILINPAIEEFILNAVNELGINLEEYNLPTELEKLKKITKTISAKENPLLSRLFRDLRGASNFSCLNAILQYLLEHKYSASNDEIFSLLQSLSI